MITKEHAALFLTLLLIVLIYSGEATKNVSCRCADKLQPVCDERRMITFPSRCLAICFGARSDKLRRGHCKAKVQVVQRNICPHHLTERRNQRAGTRRVEERSVSDLSNHKRLGDTVRRRRHSVQNLVDRLQSASLRISAIDNRLVQLQTSNDQAKMMNGTKKNGRNITRHGHDLKKKKSNNNNIRNSRNSKNITKQFNGFTVRGAEKCPQGFTLQTRVFRARKLTVRSCVPNGKGKLLSWPAEGPTSCAAGQVVHVSRHAGGAVQRNCVPVRVIGPTSCDQRPNYVLYRQRVGVSEIHNTCVPKCPSGFRIKINQVLGAGGQVVRWCIFGPAVCARGFRKEYQVFKLDKRVLKSICVPITK